MANFPAIRPHQSASPGLGGGTVLRGALKALAVVFCAVSLDYPKVVGQARVTYNGSNPFTTDITFFGRRELPFKTDSTNKDTSSIYAVIWFSKEEYFILKTKISAPTDTLSEGVLNYFLKGIGAKKIEGEQMNEPHFQGWVIDSVVFGKNAGK